jgi:prolipoprotein diacylglyceryl transferase
MLPLSIPSPSKGVVHLGPVPVRGYALCIIAGIVVAVWLSERRWKARGGRPGQIQDIALWAVPFGLVGGRLYHVITDHNLYFGEGRHPIEALYVWRGGLGVWGAIALGVVGGVIGAKRMGIKIPPLLDVALPTCLIAQAMGRWGNWFNQELYGRPTDLPWGLKIDPSNWPEGRTFPPGTTFHPTFLYESLWCVLGFFFVLWLERRFRLGHGRVAALYVMTYTLGRFWIEQLRIDTIELNNVLGLRWADWMSIILFVLAAAYFVWATRNRPGREESLYVEGRGPVADEPVADAPVADEPGDDDGTRNERERHDEARNGGADSGSAGG